MYFTQIVIPTFTYFRAREFDRRFAVRRPHQFGETRNWQCFILVPGGVYFPGFQALGGVRRRRRTRAYTTAPLRPRRGPRPFAAAAPPPRRLCGVAAARALANPFYPPFCAPPPCHRVPGGAHCPRRSPSSRTTTTVTETPPSAAVPVGTVTDAAQAPEGRDNIFIRRCPYMPPIGTWIWAILCNVF